MDARNFILTSDFPIDTIVKVVEDSLTVPASSFGTSEIEHNLGFTPLVMGNYSTSPSFNVVYEFDTGPISSSGQDLFLYRPDARANSTHTTVTLGTFFTTGSVTIYYRLYCLKPTTAPSIDIPFTSEGSDNFVLNSEYNYTKLHMAGTINVPDNFTLTPQNFPIEHNLGYRPQVIIWIERDGMIMPKSQSNPRDGSLDCIVNTNNIVIQTTMNVAARVHYRIYIDE